MRHRTARTAGLAVALVLAAGLATPTRNVGAAPEPLPLITSISAGGDHSCALTAQAAPLCWGSNRSGELGDGSTSSAIVPSAVVGLTDALRSISPGTFHTCGVGTSGHVWCWGRYAVGSPGTSLVPAQVVGLSGIRAVASGRLHACGLTAEGGVMCWGRNTKGQLGNGTSASAYLLSGPSAVVGLSSGVTEIVAGDAYSCAVTNAGRVKCWGDNQFGQLGNGTTTGSLVPVNVVGLTEAHGLAAGGLHACAITAFGRMSCWGRNNYGQLGDGTTTDRLTPVTVAELPEETTQIAAGVLHTCALGAPSSAVRCWGSNIHGELGGTLSGNSSTPVEVTRLASGGREIAAGDGHTCALLASGAVTCWGYNGYGQLGDGSTTTTFRGMPVTAVDFVVHPKIVNLSALGSAVTNPFSAPTKVTRAAAAVTWRAQTLPARPGEQLEVWMATKPPHSFTWSAFTHVADVRLDADGYAYFAYRSSIPQWVSIRFVLPGNGIDAALTSLARPATYR